MDNATLIDLARRMLLDPLASPTKSLKAVRGAVRCVGAGHLSEATVVSVADTLAADLVGRGVSVNFDRV